MDRRRRRRCGNVETRVLWGFPSSVSGAGIRLGKEDRPARGASFPQRTSIFRGLARLCPFSTRSRSRTASPEKPRSVRVFTDSRSEPVLLLAGEHVITVRQDGYQDFTERFVLQPEDKREKAVADEERFAAQYTSRDADFDGGSYARKVVGQCKHPHSGVVQQ